MVAPSPSRIDSIEIPHRPAVASKSQGVQLTRKQLVLYGGISSAALLLLVVVALLGSGSDEVARAPAETPLITAGDQPIKVSPESPGGMEVRNRDIIVYKRLQGTPTDKESVERILLPEPEQPLTPPSPPRPAQTPSVPVASPMDAPLATDRPGSESLSEPPVPGSPVKPSELGKVAPPVSVNPKLPASSSPTAPAAATPITRERSPVRPTSPPAKTAALPFSGSGFQIQLFSSRSADEANGAWSRLKSKNGDLLGPLSRSVVRAEVRDRGAFYRLRAGPIASEAKARSICDSLSARGVSCLVVRSSS